MGTWCRERSARVTIQVGLESRVEAVEPRIDAGESRFDHTEQRVESGIHLREPCVQPAGERVDP